MAVFVRAGVQYASARAFEECNKIKIHSLWSGRKKHFIPIEEITRYFELVPVSRTGV